MDSLSPQQIEIYLWLAGAGLIVLLLLAVLAYLLVRSRRDVLKATFHRADAALSERVPGLWDFVKHRFSLDTWHRLVLAGAAFLFLITVYVSAEVTDGWHDEETLYRIDQAVWGLLEEGRSETITAVMQVITRFGDVLTTAAITAVVAAWLAFRRHRWQLVGLVLTVGGGQGIVWGLKALFARERPALGLTSAVGHSFPSGHAFTATVLYGFLIFLSWRYLRRPAGRIAVTIGLGLLILLVAASRVLLRVHWVSDVLGGLSIGLAWLIFALLGTHILQAHWSAGRGISPPTRS